METLNIIYIAGFVILTVGCAYYYNAYIDLAKVYNNLRKDYKKLNDDRQDFIKETSKSYDEARKICDDLLNENMLLRETNIKLVDDYNILVRKTNIDNINISKDTVDNNSNVENENTDTIIGDTIIPTKDDTNSVDTENVILSLNGILDKINDKGIDSLSEIEKIYLSSMNE